MHNTHTTNITHTHTHTRMHTNTKYTCIRQHKQHIACERNKSNLQTTKLLAHEHKTNMYTCDTQLIIIQNKPLHTNNTHTQKSITQQKMNANQNEIACIRTTQLYASENTREKQIFAYTPRSHVEEKKNSFQPHMPAICKTKPGNKKKKAACRLKKKKRNRQTKKILLYNTNIILSCI